jgi:hypothetical protein
MVVVKRGKKWLLLSKRTGRVLGTHTSRADAVKQETAINISKARAAGHRIPYPKNQKA